MKSKRLEDTLGHTLKNGVPEIRNSHLGETISLAEEGYRKYGRRERIGFGGLLLRQIQFIGWKMWLFQGGYLFIVINIIRFLFHEETLGMRYISYILCFVSIMLVWTAVPIIGRSIRFRMIEIENTTLFSGGKLLIAQILVIGCGGLPVVGSIIWVMTSRYLYQFSEVIFSMVLPLLAFTGMFLYLLRRVKAYAVVRACNLVGGICLLIVIQMGRQGIGNLMELPKTVGWIACAVCLIVCIVQIKAIWRGNCLTERIAC